MEQSLFQISAQVPLLAEEPVTAAFETALKRPACSYTDHETLQCRVSVYGPTSESPKHIALQKLASSLRALVEMEVLPSQPRLSVRHLRAQDWAESWKRHFHPLDVLGQLLIKPSWSRRRPKARQATIILDPGLSFGTGQHPTTHYCLTQVVRLRPKASPLPFLDMGTGSGILAIAAAKLGYDTIDAFDFDPKAVEVARENARTNGVEGRIRLRQADLTKLPKALKKPYSLVCANILADILMRESRQIRDRVRPGGHVVLAGILRQQFPAVTNCFEQLGLKLIDKCADKEWESGTFWLRQATADSR